METKSPPTCPYSVTVRRNPPRKARPTTTAKSRQIPAHSSSWTVPEVPSFPTEEILSMEVSENPNPKSDSSASENLRVFLRIRPLLPSTTLIRDQNPKSRARNVWPQNPAKKNPARDKISNKKKTRDACVKANDHQSVTLSPPLNLQESKRVKSEVYEGFSHVFASDSSQEEVYEKMVSPLVEDFLTGKSGMLATLGPSGSGKTHTVFGTPRDPGILPRTLHRIFKPNVEMGSEPRRSFSISIFEIQSERKGEKLFDLSPGGAELSMQNSTIKGLQEVTVSDARQAESLVAHAMLNRLTASTNANSQSSRSQCIINICSVASKFKGEDDYQGNNVVLSIVDLAGAEREKKTGNQGARLVESNFINNTSMVFGLCLRSLLEHQKNPKRPLQKHFQNSLLTRYLRDYLEGKKRMALILTVKSGEEDYLDTTYLLRHASPFMRIRFDNVEEQQNNKRQSQALSRNERLKRMKFSGVEACVIEEGNANEDEHRTSGQVCAKEDPKIFKSEIPDCASLESSYVELAEKERSSQIWQNFAKAFWNALRQYKEKLKVAEHEIQHLTENLKLEKTRYVELEKKLEEAKSCGTCSQQKSVEIALVETERNFNQREKLNGLGFSDFDESKADLCSSNTGPSECHCSPQKYDSTPRRDQVMFSKTNIEQHAFNVRAASESIRTSDKFDFNPDENQNISPQVQVREYCPSQWVDKEQELDGPVRSLVVGVVDDSYFSGEFSQQKNRKDPIFSGSGHNAEDLQDSKCLEMDDACVDNEQVKDAPVRSLVVDVGDDSSLSVEISQKYQIDPIFSGSGHNAGDLQDSICLETDDTNADVTDLTVSSSQSLVMRRDESCSSVELDNVLSEEEQGSSNLPELEDIVSTKVCATLDSLVCESRVEKSEELLDPLTSVQENLVITKDSEDVNAPSSEQRVDMPSKPEKPRRRLLPASSVLLRDFNTLDIDDKSEKRKESKGGKKFNADERNRTQGSISLLRLLNHNVRV
ncbi:Kinesin-like protein [Parasponia andersonii]|uniref:Kinesin-like protein n=1 Tax=Parasponia andersonii TaxID=3476 RepID=A0A2P5DJF3_PARAD|nr:Kinesin-like protein [Parasponia andersonii]